MTTRPTRVEYDGRSVPVKWGTNLGRNPHGYPIIGEWDKPGIVKMANGSPPHIERVTLLHELLHDVFHAANVNLRKSDEEYILNSVDTWLFDMLDQNPDLREYLWD